MTEALTQQTAISKGRPGPLKIFFVRLVLFWEAFWPAILHAVAIPFTLIIISLFGLWRFVPDWLHWSTLLLAGAAFGGLLWRDLKTVSWPSKTNAQQRLEEDGRVAHAAVQALDDTPFDGMSLANPLWQAHMADMAERARKAKLTGLRSGADARDPFALRFTAIGVLAVALIAAGDDWRMRLASGASPGSGTYFGKLVADVWIDPPDYTGKAPIYLLRPGDDVTGLRDQINVPAGSQLIAQIGAGGRAQLKFADDDSTQKIPLDRVTNSARGAFVLETSGLVSLQMNGRGVKWPIGVVRDAPPTVIFQETPAENDDGRVGFSVVTGDDYAISSARLVLRLAPDQERPLDAPAFDDGALSEEHVFELDDLTGAPGPRYQLLDLREDPWAGLIVLARIEVRDGAGQTGVSEEIDFTLPERAFFNPLAKAVIEQRQSLAIAPQAWQRAGRSFDALTLAPEVFFDDTTDFLLLRTAFWRVMRRNNENFDDAVAQFWPLALQLEDKALELARQRLEAAQEALRQALERGASDEEIERLVENLRQAMNDYLQALAQSGQPTDGQAARNAEQLSQSDLDEMLNSIQDLAQSGAQSAARQMLSELENLLNNLQLTQGGQGSGQGGQGQSGQGQSGQGAGNGAGGLAGDAADLIGRQRELADEAFERGQNFGESGGDLASREGGLGEALDDLIDELTGNGGEADPNGDAARALGGARNAMRDAQEALDANDFGTASSAMERAIQQLREGAEGLAREQMRQANGEQGDGMGRGQTDPLGRDAGRGIGNGVDVPEETDAGRTRAVIDELRRRLGDQTRDEDEIEYLERLLERF